MDHSPVCVSFDIDWAPDFMIDELTALLARAPRPFTVFCTHDSPATRRLLALPGCEAALHPNFLAAAEPGSDTAPLATREARVLDDLRARFPDARGVRNHALYYHSRLLALFHRADIAYLSNDLCFLAPGLAPHRDWSGLVRVPIYWEDDVHCVYFDQRFDLDALAMDRPGLQVFNFHPVHVYLNTADLCAYQRAKPALADRARAEPLRRQGAGVRALLEALLAAVPAARCRTVGAVAGAFDRVHPYTGRYADYLARAEALSVRAEPGEEPT